MSSEFAIRVDGISKHYLMFDKPEDRLRQMVLPRVQRLAGREPKRYYRDFAALHGISFEIKRGETVGIIGRNGSGKSTLLQIICGTLQPTSGTVEVNGRIAALLELGAGFNPEFTGRENVFLNAAILGLSRQETEARFDDIARFADIGMFIDQPVKTYSSGMYVRLAFATAINVDPDILVVDEALSVGDEAFQRKCFARIEDIKDKGGTILFVSHGAQTVVQLCDRAMLIDRGELLLEGQPKLVTSQYQRLIYAPADQEAEVRTALSASSEHVVTTTKTQPESRAAANESLESFNPALISTSTIVYAENGASISDVQLLNEVGEKVNVLEHGKRYKYRYRCRFTDDMPMACFNMLLKTTEGLELFAQSSHLFPAMLEVRAGQTVEVTFSFHCLLMPGVYFGNAGVSGPDSTLHRIVDAAMFVVAPYTPQRTIMRHVNLALEEGRRQLTAVDVKIFDFADDAPKKNPRRRLKEDP